MSNATQALAGLSGLSSSLMGIITSHAYIGILILMLLESASLPIPSEIILPAVGELAAAGALNVWLGLVVAIAGSMIGIMIDYYIAYFVGKDIVYKHLGAFHVKKGTLDAFDAWFSRNGSFAVFISRLIPVVRGLISFPAGFAEMPKGQFLLYSFAGTVIWDAALIFFGYYALSTKNITLLFAAVAGFAVVLYLIYVFALKRIRNTGKTQA
jgi:membrane protein DedA with SNARE-associated domain